MTSIRRERCVVCGERLGSHTRAGLRYCKAKLAELPADRAEHDQAIRPADGTKKPGSPPA